MKASLLFDQDPHILEIMTTVLPAGLPTVFAYQLLLPSAPPLLALLLAGAWLFSRAARMQPEEALCQPGRRFSPCFGAGWRQRALAKCRCHQHAGDSRAGPGWSWVLHPGKHIVAAVLHCPPANTPSQRCLSIFCQKGTGKEGRRLTGRGGQRTRLVSMLLVQKCWVQWGVLINSNTLQKSVFSSSLSRIYRVFLLSQNKSINCISIETQVSPNYQILHLYPRLAIYPNLDQCHSDHIYLLVVLWTQDAFRYGKKILWEKSKLKTLMSFYWNW